MENMKNLILYLGHNESPYIGKLGSAQDERYDKFGAGQVYLMSSCDTGHESPALMTWTWRSQPGNSRSVIRNG